MARAAVRSGTWLLWGRPRGPSTYLLARWLFLRLLGVVYLIAFVSLWVQIDGLIGSRGILPAAPFLKAAGPRLGSEAWLRLPTVCWWNADDAFLHGLCAGGAGLALLLIIGIAPVPVLFLLWCAYLSLVTVGREFLWFQWDILLLETGFLALWLAPWGLWPRLRAERPPSAIAHFMLRWLLLRLMFLSALVKVWAGDATWTNWTALTVHYETQPLPTWTAWYAHQFPLGFQKVCVGVTLGIELLLPLLIFFPRRPRHLAAAAFIFLMVCIAATGNYNFFNLLTVALSLLLLDDAVLSGGPLKRVWPRQPSGDSTTSNEVTPSTTYQRLEKEFSPTLQPRSPMAASSWFRFAGPTCSRLKLSSGQIARFSRGWRVVPLVLLAVAYVLLSLAAAVQRLQRCPGSKDFFETTRSALAAAPETIRKGLAAVDHVYGRVTSFHTINAYGLFQSMTVTRPEIIIEGSDDGQTWLPYEFQWKPGDLLTSK